MMQESDFASFTLMIIFCTIPWVLGFKTFGESMPVPNKDADIKFYLHNYFIAFIPHFPLLNISRFITILIPSVLLYIDRVRTGLKSTCIYRTVLKSL